MITQNDITKFKDQGYLIVKNVFSKEEILKYRKKALDSVRPYTTADKGAFFFAGFHEIDLTQDFLSNPEFREVILEPRIVEISKKVLGDTPAFFGFSRMNVAYEGITMKPHRDNIDHSKSKGLDWKCDDYSIFRIGIYLQDYTQEGGRIWVNPESHKGPNEGKKAVVVTHEIGDVVVWDYRSKHSVSTIHPKFTFGYKMPSALEFLYHRLYSMFVPTNRKRLKEPRVYFHILFGLDDTHADRVFDRWKDTEHWLVKMWRNSNYDEEAKILAAQANIKLLDYNKRIKEYNQKSALTKSPIEQ